MGLSHAIQLPAEQKSGSPRAEQPAVCLESDSPQEDYSIPFLLQESPEHQDAEADFQRETL